MDDPQQMVWIIMYSSIGASYLLYGLRRGRRVASFAGAGFLALPHVLGGGVVLLGLGALLLLAPIIWRHSSDG